MKGTRETAAASASCPHPDSGVLCAARVRPAEVSAGFLLAQAHARSHELLRQLLAELELTPPQFGALLTVHANQGLSQAELGELGGKDRATIGGIVDRLVGRGLLERRHGPGDRRAYRLGVTRRGAEVAARCVGVHRAHEEALLAPLSGAEREKLFRLLQKITPAAEPARGVSTTKGAT
jgi:DNA-binding MarR family transcriptional regulator